MSYSIIAAVGKNNELGANNDLIWHLKKDLKFFRKMTNGKTIIMGRKTFESLPKMLPNRHHIVLSSSNNFPQEVSVYNSFEELINDYKDVDEEIFIIGGSSIYVYFPSFDKEKYDREIIDSEEENNIQYKHVLYKRK